MSGAADIPAGRCVVFRAGAERFALPLEAVREVVLPQPPFARVPRSGAAVRGVMNLRGRVLPVVDLAALLELPAPAPLGERDGQVLVLEGPRPSMGLLVSSVLGVEALAAELPATGLSRGLGQARDGAATLLDVAALGAAAGAQFGAGARDKRQVRP
jgi:purine-binding chemotaxis protein CheW